MDIATTLMSKDEVRISPSFKEAFLFWLKLGWISFGGPAGQIAIMHQELVDRKKWISNDRFLHALNYCMLLPGPEAQRWQHISAGFSIKPGAGSSPGYSLSCLRYSSCLASAVSILPSAPCPGWQRSLSGSRRQSLPLSWPQ